MTLHKTPISRRALLAATGAGAAMLAAPAILRAQGKVLTCASWVPLVHPVPGLVLPEWADMIRERTDGRVDIAITDTASGPPTKQYDRLQSGEADIAFSLHGYSGDDAFKRSQVGQFSFLGDSYSASQAYSKVYYDQLDPVSEHPGVKLLSVFQHGPGVLFLKNRKVDRPEDFKGLRLRTSGGYISKMLTDLGVVTVPMSPLKVREAMAAGDIDGVAFPYEGGESFGILEQTTEVSEIPGGYYNATWFLGMSPQAWGGIERRDQRQVARVSSEFIPLLAAKAFDFYDYQGRELFRTSGVPIKSADASIVSAIERTGGRYEKLWIDELAAQGFNGAKALRDTRKLTGLKRG